MLYHASGLMDIRKRLEIYRLENKISQEDLAATLGVAFSTVNRWLNGKVKPNKIQTYHIKKLMKSKVIYAKRK
jgi:transcriptional regulator with XRE-family HTH domain